MDIKLIRPYIAFDEVEDQFKEVFSSGMFSNGKNVKALRKEFANYVGSDFCSLTTSATTALWLCLKLLNVKEGDEVAISDYSYPATANVVEDLGATPVFVDVDIETFNMNPEKLKELISSKTKAVIFVDALGNPSGLSEIKSICLENNIPLIEDAACAVGSSESKKKCGSIADLTCFSFHPRKLICAGEGGAITTNNKDWADWLEIKLSHGVTGFNKHRQEFEDYGYNFRLSELQAVMVRNGLLKLEEIIDDRINIQKKYSLELSTLGFEPQLCNKEVRHNIQSLVFKTPSEVNRDDLVLSLRDQGIETTIGTYCLSKLGYFSKKYGIKNPCASILDRDVISFPCFEGLDVERVISSIKSSI